MKSLQPYWFLQNPIDAEHKYYVLMDFLQSVENDLGQKKYSEQIQKITRVYNDIKNFGYIVPQGSPMYGIGNN